MLIIFSNLFDEVNILVIATKEINKISSMCLSANKAICAKNETSLLQLICLHKVRQDNVILYSYVLTFSDFMLNYILIQTHLSLIERHDNFVLFRVFGGLTFLSQNKQNLRYKRQHSRKVVNNSIVLPSRWQ